MYYDFPQGMNPYPDYHMDSRSDSMNMEQRRPGCGTTEGSRLAGSGCGCGCDCDCCDCCCNGRGPTGPTGPQGPRGCPGIQGPTGATAPFIYAQPLP